MKQLTMNDIYNLCNMLQSRGCDLSKLKVYLGDDDAINYGLGLYNIAKRYSNGTKWEESWLEDFKNELENF